MMIVMIDQMTRNQSATSVRIMVRHGANVTIRSVANITPSAVPATLQLTFSAVATPTTASARPNHDTIRPVESTRMRYSMIGSLWITSAVPLVVCDTR